MLSYKNYISIKLLLLSNNTNRHWEKRVINKTLRKKDGRFPKETYSETSAGKVDIAW